MPLPISTIVAAVDLDDDLGDAVLRTAAGLAECLGARLHVIDAWPKLEGVAYPYARKAEVSEIKEYEHVRSQRRQALDIRARALCPTAVTMIPVGETTDSISRYLENERADLLVIGSHQKGFWEKMFMGSTSADAIKNAPCAVFVVPPPFADKIDKAA